MRIIGERVAAAFADFGWLSVLEIAAAVVAVYGLLAFLRRNKLLALLKYVVVVTAVFWLALALFTSRIDDPAVNTVIVTVVMGVVTMAFAIVFRNETRRDVFKLASPHREAGHFNGSRSVSDEELQTCIAELVRGCITLAKANTGALIIIGHDNNMPQHILDSGTRLGSLVTAPLLECLFNTKAPLHDGAVVVEGDRIVAAGCFLPLSQNISLPKELGTRHRAGIGITETADVLSVIVSEETGIISIVKNGVITRYYDANMLTQAFEQFYGLKATQPQPLRRKRR